MSKSDRATRHVALLRGINVGRAKRVPMAELRALLGELGHRDIRTLLNSGNAIFEASAADVPRIATEIESALRSTFGFDVAVVVQNEATFRSVVGANPLVPVADASRFLVAFARSSRDLDAARSLLERTWGSEALALGSDAAYLWCPAGILASPLLTAFQRATREATTTRNWATVLRIHAMLEPREG